MRSIGVVIYLGSLYIVLGFLLWSNLIDHNFFNHPMLPYVIASLSITSVALAALDFSSCLLSCIIIDIRLNLLTKEKHTELSLHKKIYEASSTYSIIDNNTEYNTLLYRILNKVQSLISSNINTIYSGTIAYSILLPLYEPIVKFDKKCLVLISFGFFILTLGLREYYRERKRNTINYLWYSYYKSKTEENIEKEKV